MCFKIKPGESLDEFFACFHKILVNLHVVNVTFIDTGNARQLIGALDMSIQEMKVTSIKQSTIMSTFTLDVLYSKLKTHKLDILALKHGSKSASQSSKLHYDNFSASNVLSFFPKIPCPFSLLASLKLYKIPLFPLILIIFRVQQMELHELCSTPRVERPRARIPLGMSVSDEVDR